MEIINLIINYNYKICFIVTSMGSELTDIRDDLERLIDDVIKPL